MKKIFLNGIKIILYIPLLLILFYLVECINPTPVGFGISDAEWGFVDIHFWVSIIPVMLFIAFLNHFLDKKIFYKKKWSKLLGSSITDQAREKINIALEDLAKKRQEHKEECRENVGQGNTGFLEESIEKIDAEFYSEHISSAWKIFKDVVDNHSVPYSKNLEEELKDIFYSEWVRQPAESSDIVKTAWASALRKIDSEICDYVQSLKAKTIPWYSHPLGKWILGIVGALIAGFILRGCL